MMDLVNEVSNLTSSSTQGFAKTANIAGIVSRLTATVPRLQSTNPTSSTLFFSSAKSLSSEAPDPRTLRFIYSKAVNRALEDYANYANAGNMDVFCITNTDIVIEKLPEIYDSMIFMGQKQPMQKRKRRNQRIKKKERSTLDTPSTRACSIAPSTKQLTMPSSTRSSQRITLPSIRASSITPSRKRSRKSVVLPQIVNMTSSLH